MENLLLFEYIDLWEEIGYLIGWILIAIGLLICGVELSKEGAKFKIVKGDQRLTGLFIVAIGSIIFFTTYDILHRPCVKVGERLGLQSPNITTLIIGIIIIVISFFSLFKELRPFSKEQRIKIFKWGLATSLVIIFLSVTPILRFQEIKAINKEEMRLLLNQHVREKSSELIPEIKKYLVDSLADFKLEREIAIEKLRNENIEDFLIRLSKFAIEDSLRIVSFKPGEELCGWKSLKYSMGIENELEAYLTVLATSQGDKKTMNLCYNYFSKDCKFKEMFNKTGNAGEVYNKDVKSFLNEQYASELAPMTIIELVLNKKSGLVDTLKYIQ